MANLTLTQLTTIEGELAQVNRQVSGMIEDFQYLDALLGSTPSITLGTELSDLNTAKAGIQKALSSLRKKITDDIWTETGNS